MEETAAKPSLVRRLVAIVVLALAALILLKIVIGFVSAIASTIVIIIAVVGILWAINVIF